MKPVTSISQIASLLADPKRSAMLWALIDGVARPSDELADMAGLTPSSACAHLARLSASGLLKLEPRGRKRYFRLAGPEIGAAVEALASVQVTSREINAAREDAGIPLSMRRARLCGDHLGGELAADLYQRLFDAGWLEGLEQQIEVTQEGRTQFACYGIFIESLARYQRRNFSSCRCCSEWTDHRPHLGGALGSSLLKLFMQSGWIRESETSRMLQINAAGLRQINGIAHPVTLQSVG
ncbi:MULTISPECIES: helix-turn-helix transcriptional regulator [Pseudomonas]|uniref:ArsR/SmtB family transcription factor n=1 Tax=Pseudomonas sp. Hg7Tf TaxID=3236988 RepID=A0AB39I047_9PSED|nr:MULTISPECIES: helix-turn-helix transcriptional regulator [Pseudomonas]KJK09194.1 ArsR family transcriptional regulator [Pseudomonas sp. 5]MDD1975510.1 ArsR family transcriptional regulator [Pseudomonas putida]QYX45839.1 ArsR family transcriptional regulator [Pseudomonas sp. S11A 273]